MHTKSVLGLHPNWFSYILMHVFILLLYPDQTSRNSYVSLKRKIVSLKRKIYHFHVFWANKCHYKWLLGQGESFLTIFVFPITLEKCVHDSILSMSVWSQEAFSLLWGSLPSSALISSSWSCDPLCPPMISFPQYWIPNSLRTGHTFFISHVLQHTCVHLDTCPLHSAKIWFLVPRKKDGRQSYTVVPYSSTDSCYNLQSLDFAVPLLLLISSASSLKSKCKVFLKHKY